MGMLKGFISSAIQIALNHDKYKWHLSQNYVQFVRAMDATNDVW